MAADLNVFARRLLAAAALLCFACAAQAALPIQHWQTPQGTRVYFVETHDLPMLDVSVEFSAGSSRDVPAKAGVANLTRHMMGLGAGGLTDDQISARMADVGASLGGTFDLDRGGYGVRTLSSNREREQAIGILEKVLQQPDFPDAVLEREKARVISAIKEAQTQPESIASKAFYAALYGSHPYSIYPSGEVETVQAIKRDDLVNFYKTWYTADNAVVSIVGDISRKDAEALALRLTGRLPKAANPVPPLPGVKPVNPPPVRAISHPASQAHILLGYPGVKRGDPDYFPLLVGNYVLGGGGFASRLIEEVRQKRGYAYSAYSYFAPLKDPGPFTIGLQTKKDQADEALTVVRKTLRDFIAQGPTPDELKKAKQNLILGFPLRLDSNRKILDNVSTIGFYQLPLTYLDDFTKNIEKVTLAQVKDAFARRINPDGMVTVTVGAK